MVEQLLPDMVDQLEPFWADFTASGGSEFGDYLAKRGDEVSEALLAGDRRQGRGLRPADDRQGLHSVRGSAAKHIEAALPALGALVQKYAG